MGGSSPSWGANKINSLADIGEALNFSGGTQGEHFTANFVINGVRVKTLTVSVASYLTLTFLL